MRYRYPVHAFAGHHRAAGVTVIAAVALLTAAVQYALTGSPATAARALPAGALAAAVALLAASLPGLSLRGLVTGGFFVLAGTLSWTYLDRGAVVWTVLAVEGVVFLCWSWPWLSHLRPLPRLGSAWLGLSYWLLGIVGALLVGHLVVAGQRVAYAGVFTLAALTVLAGVRGRPAAVRDVRDGLRGPGGAGRGTGDRPGRDLSVGIAGAFLLAIAALLLSGSGNLFSALHVVPAGQWGRDMEHRFWGGAWLLYHPNSLALIAVVVAIRIGADPAFALYQRLAVTGLAGFVIYESNSRTGFVYFGAAAALHGYLLWRHRDRLPGYRRPWLAAAQPFVVLALILVLSGGQGFLFQDRYSDAGLASGRTDTWRAVGVEWVHAGWAERLFGDARTSRAVVQRADDGTKPGEQRLKLTTDNAAVAALRRGGVLGVLAFGLGLALLLSHAWRGPRVRAGEPGPGGAGEPTRVGRRCPPAWLTIAAVGSVPTIATADWLLGGTGGTLWILLLAGEAWLLFGNPEAQHDKASDRDAADGLSVP